LKKIIAAFAGILIFSNSFCQESIRFTMGLSPNHSYDQSIDQKIKIEINLDSSSAEMISQMESSGMKNPTNQEQETKLEALIRSGSINSRTGKMPVTSSYMSSDEKISKILTPGTKIFGTAGPNELPVYDSISGASMDETHKSQMLKMMSAVSQFNLPNRNLMVGQSDTLNNVLNFPVAGLILKIDCISIYYLKSIQGNTAQFDIKKVFKLNAEMKDVPVEGSGSGDGTMEYDLKERYPTMFNFNYKMKVRIRKEELIMHMNIDNNINLRCKIQTLQ
jgi:hypothetical protein